MRSGRQSSPSNSKEQREEREQFTDPLGVKPRRARLRAAAEATR